MGHRQESASPHSSPASPTAVHHDSIEYDGILNTKGKRKKFSVKLHIEGSILQKKIWKQLSEIGYGTTKTYGEIATVLHTSPRYVGNVCGQNNHLIIIPCHRVVRSDGGLGGFSGMGGIKLKMKLINLERK